MVYVVRNINLFLAFSSEFRFASQKLDFGWNDNSAQTTENLSKIIYSTICCEDLCFKGGPLFSLSTEVLLP
jgi:hypothetical protein